MNALSRRKQQWESQNQEILVRLVHSSSDVSVKSVKHVGRVSSFLLYLVYKVIEGALALAAALLRGPALVRVIGPGQRPLEYHEFNRSALESQLELVGKLR